MVAQEPHPDHGLSGQPSAPDPQAFEAMTREDLQNFIVELQSTNAALLTTNAQHQETIAELELTSNDLLNLLSSTDAATLLLDLKLHIKRYTPAVTALFNLLPNDLGRPLSAITRHFEEPDLIQAAQRVIVTLQPSQREIQQDDGRWFIRCIRPYRTLNNQLDGVVITFAEVSELKQVEQALRLSEQRFRTALRSSPITIFEQDRNLRYTWIYNPAFGHDEAQIVGQTDAELFDDPDDIDRLTALKHQVIQSGRGQRQQMSVRQVGRRYVFDIAIEPLLQDTLITGITCVVNDITAHAQLQEERLLLLERAEAAQAEAEHGVQLRNVFVSIASHELKTPLTALLGNAALLSQRMQRGEPPDERSQRFAQTIVTQAERLNTLITLLLDVSRIDNGSLTISLEAVDTGALVAQTIAEIQPTLVSHTLQYRPPARPLWVKGDSLRLQQVIHNVLGNAVKYSPEGGRIEVSVCATRASVAIAISDPGIGIPEAAQLRIFEQFYRAANAEAAHIQGMGIGLFVVQQIISLHGGTLHVRSQLGMGSTFTILLPALVEPGLHA